MRRGLALAVAITAVLALAAAGAQGAATGRPGRRRRCSPTTTSGSTRARGAARRSTCRCSAATRPTTPPSCASTSGGRSRPASTGSSSAGSRRRCSTNGWRSCARVAAAEHFKLGIVYQGLDFHRQPAAGGHRRARPRVRSPRTYGDDPVFRIFDRPVVVWSGTWRFSRRRDPAGHPARARPAARARLREEHRRLRADPRRGWTATPTTGRASIRGRTRATAEARRDGAGGARTRRPLDRARGARLRRAR